MVAEPTPKNTPAAGFQPTVAPVSNRCEMKFTHLLRPFSRLLTTAALILCAVGCRPVDTRFQVVAFRDPAHPETLSEHFNRGSFLINAENNYEIVFEIPPASISSSQPAATDQNGNFAEAEPVWMSQFIHIEVFWRPRPGTTYAESTQTNANILYCIATGDGAISYEGAGFVYLDLSRDGQRLSGTLESSTLYPARFTKAPTDLFGPCRMTGTFQALRGRPEVARVQQILRRLLGPPLPPNPPASK